MRVCTARQMAAIDRETIDGGVPGAHLMENAGRAMTEVLLDWLAESGTADQDHHGACGHEHDEHAGEGDGPAVLILCGKGNNGGDGLVMARLLAEQDCTVGVMLLGEPEALSPDARLNHDRLPDSVTVIVAPPDLWPDTFRDLADDADVVVDAVFGTGIKPPLRDTYASLFRAVNDAGMPCVAVDIPSGVSSDDGRVDPVAVAADLTLTVGLPKLGLLLAPGRDFVGDLEVVDIGFDEDACLRNTDNLHWLERREYLELLPPRPGTSHKYQCGRLLIAAGSRNFGGAAHLAGMGALRSGAGLVSLAVPMCLETASRVLLPEALTWAVAETDAGTIAPWPEAVRDELLTGQNALALGPGMGDDPATDQWVCRILADLTLPVVVDADALNAFARTGQEPAFGSDQVVLTPHVGELARLTGLTTAEVTNRRLSLAGELAARWQVVLMLKGSPTVIGAPDGRVFINPTGDDALARGGSGDVLTGLVGGLLAQGVDALEAALLGAYLHGRAGTMAARGRSNRSVLVREIANALGPVFEEMEKEASATAPLREKIWPTDPAGQD